jgi:hypothetical protein
MNIEESIKKWVVLDNQHKKLNSQISKLRDDKNELTQTIINYYTLHLFSFKTPIYSAKNKKKM